VEDKHKRGCNCARTCVWVSCACSTVCGHVYHPHAWNTLFVKFFNTPTKLVRNSKKIIQLSNYFHQVVKFYISMPGYLRIVTTFLNIIERFSLWFLGFLHSSCTTVKVNIRVLDNSYQYAYKQKPDFSNVLSPTMTTWIILYRVVLEEKSSTLKNTTYIRLVLARGLRKWHENILVFFIEASIVWYMQSNYFHIFPMTPARATQGSCSGYKISPVQLRTFQKYKGLYLSRIIRFRTLVQAY
jgi:hypothetical protein